MDALVWLNGRVVGADEATVATRDHGLTVGDGVFETLKVVGQTPFAFTRHLARLRRSLAVLDLVVPMDDAGFRTAANELIACQAASGTKPERLRITVTAGPGPLGSGRSATAPTVILAATPGTPWPPTERITQVPWVRNERSAVAGAKTTSYAENVVALAHAKRHGAGEAIFANTVGALCEGTGTNIFLGRDGRLLTPATSSGCLAGITRELVCELIEVEQSERLTLADLGEADEIFLTSSTRDVHPVSHLDELPVTSAPGPLTIAAIEAFAALVDHDLDP